MLINGRKTTLDLECFYNGTKLNNVTDIKQGLHNDIKLLGITFTSLMSYDLYIDKLEKKLNQ